MLLVGRLLIQKRLYYGLLRSGGVLQFSGNSCFRDRLVVFLILGALHCLVFMCVTSPLLGQFVKFFQLAFNDTENGGDQTDNQKLVDQTKMLYTLVASSIPIITITVGAYLTYDITSTLVPLSQYVQDAESAHTALNTLRPMHETLIRDLTLKEDLQSGNSPLGTAWAHLGGTGIIEAYVNSGTHDSAEPGHVDLRDSLWPAALLARGGVWKEGAASFEHAWLGFASISSIWTLNMVIYLLRFMLVDSLEGFSLPRAIFVGVLVVHLLVLAVAAHAVYEASRALFPH
jgi:hypothetical protein